MPQVTVFSTSEGKKDEALKTLGADHFVISKDEEQMQVSSQTLQVAYSAETKTCRLEPAVGYRQVSWRMAHVHL